MLSNLLGFFLALVINFQRLYAAYKITYISSKSHVTRTISIPDSDVHWIGNETTPIDLDVTEYRYYCIWVLKIGCYKPYQYSYIWGSPKRVSNLIDCNSLTRCDVQEERPNSMVSSGLDRLTTLDHLLNVIPAGLNYDMSSEQVYSQLPNMTVSGPGVFFLWFIPNGVELNFLLDPIYAQTTKHPRNRIITLPLVTDKDKLVGIYGVTNACTEQGRNFLLAIEKSSRKYLSFINDLYCSKQYKQLDVKTQGSVLLTITG